MGEGAAVLVLEEWEAARSPAAPRSSARCSGGASNADAHHITAPSPGGVGAIACMRLALADAGLEPGDIRQINAHGTSTPLNDAAEAAAVSRCSAPRTVPVVSTKGVTGHALGAAGALEAAAVLLSMKHRLIPPTANTKVVARRVGIDLVIGEPRPWEPGPTMSNNFGFGGHNGSVIIAPAELTALDASTTTKSSSHSHATSPSSSARPDPLPRSRGHPADLALEDELVARTDLAPEPRPVEAAEQRQLAGEAFVLQARPRRRPGRSPRTSARPAASVGPGSDRRRTTRHQSAANARGPTVRARRRGSRRRTGTVVGAATRSVGSVVWSIAEIDVARGHRGAVLQRRLERRPTRPDHGFYHPAALRFRKHFSPDS